VIAVHQNDRRQRSQTTTGLLLIVLGLIFFLGRVHSPFAAILSLHRLWPVLLLVAGLSKVLIPADDSEGAKAGGLWMILAAVIFLMHNYDVVSLSRTWPLFIVAGGVSLLVAGRPRRSIEASAKGGSHVE
jgi:hypothetical protein